MPLRKSREPCVMVLVTCPSRSAALRIARAAVEEGLAACVNLVHGIHSVFRWKGALEHNRESLLILKTRKSAFARLKRTILQAHPYQVPEIIALPIRAGHAPYLDWIRKSTGSR